MSITGVVRVWHAELGWGVIDADETPGGCWAHFSGVETSGYRALEVGELVELEVEAASQDGYDYRATAVWPEGGPRVPTLAAHNSPAYRSTLTITWSDGRVERRGG